MLSLRETVRYLGKAERSPASWFKLPSLLSGVVTPSAVQSQCRNSCHLATSYSLTSCGVLIKAIAMGHYARGEFFFLRRAGKPASEPITWNACQRPLGALELWLFIWWNTSQSRHTFHQGSRSTLDFATLLGERWRKLWTKLVKIFHEGTQHKYWINKQSTDWFPSCS